jgi:hypothetical protein
MPNPTVLIKIHSQRGPTEGEDQTKVYVDVETVLSESLGGNLGARDWVPITPSLTDIEFRAAVIDKGLEIQNAQIVGFATLTIADARMP